MHGRIVSFIALLTLIFFMASGCAKKEEPKTTALPAEKTVAEKAVKEEAEVKQVPIPSSKPITEERVLFSFENDLGGWEVPDWAVDKDDHVAEYLEISTDVASEGKSSMKMVCDFPGNRWTSGLVELEQYFDFTPYRQIAVDIYIPKDTPLGLRGKIILTVGEDWKFTEMTRNIPLVPGEWVTIKASIEPGSYDWKRTVVDNAFRADVRKIVVRIESNRRPVYKGPVYIDNVRLGK